MNRKAHCADCKKELIAPDPATSCGTGYGYAGRSRKRKVCYACCGLRDEKSMQKHGKATLYLSQYITGYKITNWPGTLKFTVMRHRHSRHNIAGTREDVWFKDKQGAEWHGTCYGSNTQVLHCKRLAQ